MGQFGMGQIPSHPTGMGWDRDGLGLGWDGIGTGWDWDGMGLGRILWDSGMGQNGIQWDIFVPTKYYVQTD